ncbi:MAG: hypothetical protein V1679_00695 [Candidatus Peregrinibacteria bacterium]
MSLENEGGLVEEGEGLKDFGKMTLPELGERRSNIARQIAELELEAGAIPKELMVRVDRSHVVELLNYRLGASVVSAEDVVEIHEDYVVLRCCVPDAQALRVLRWLNESPYAFNNVCYGNVKCEERGVCFDLEVPFDERGELLDPLAYGASDERGAAIDEEDKRLFGNMAMEYVEELLCYSKALNPGLSIEVLSVEDTGVACVVRGMCTDDHMALVTCGKAQSASPLQDQADSKGSVFVKISMDVLQERLDPVSAVSEGMKKGIFLVGGTAEETDEE